MSRRNKLRLLFYQKIIECQTMMLADAGGTPDELSKNITCMEVDRRGEATISYENKSHKVPQQKNDAKQGIHFPLHVVYKAHNRFSSYTN